MVGLRRKVIGEVMNVYKDSCPSLEVKELVIDPKELDYPVNTPRERTVYSVKAILSAIDEGRPFVVTKKGEKEVKSILPDESLADINKLSLLGGRDIKEVLLSDALSSVKRERQEWRLLLAIEEVLNQDNLADVIDALEEGGFTTSKWRRLGLRLSISHDDLTIIETNYPKDVVRCLEECLVKWLKTGKATYTGLAEALKIMGEGAAADYITKQTKEM